jgi:type I restriction enzyme S subunit
MTTASPWKTVTVAPFIDLINGFAFPSDRFTKDEGMPLIRIRDLDRQETEINFRGRYDNRYIVKRGDLLIGMDGDFLTVKWKGSNALLNQRVCKLVVKDAEQLNQGFLFYRIIDEIFNVNRITSATTVKHLSSSDVLGIKIDLPPKPEQTKIAEILSTVDRAIEQTEALIAKQQRIKTGLMQDLLTRGIDEHGNLRSEQTHQFKDSPLGRIPVEWDCTLLSRFVPSAEYGISTSLGESGNPVLRMNNFFEGEADISDLKYTDLKVPEKLWLRDGDVLFNRTNCWEHVGRTGIWRGQVEKAIFASYLVRLNPDPDMLLSELLNVWLNWEPTQIAMRRLATPAVQQVNINPTNLRTIHAAFPTNLNEQCEIVKRFTSMRNTISSCFESFKKLRSLKTALMQDLLTGKIRVTPLLEKMEVNA